MEKRGGGSNDVKKIKLDWASYFNAKKQKLEIQFQQNKQDNFYISNENQDSLDTDRNLLNGIGIFVNGYTNPTAFELKSLMLKYGGSYYDYMNERVTHLIASNLAHSKAVAMRNKQIIKPEWIVER